MQEGVNLPQPLLTMRGGKPKLIFLSWARQVVSSQTGLLLGSPGSESSRGRNAAREPSAQISRISTTWFATERTKYQKSPKEGI